MADEDSEDTFEYTIDGKLMVFKKMSPTRLLLVGRMNDVAVRNVKQAEAAKDKEAYVKYTNQIMEIFWSAVEAHFIDPDDLAHVQQAVIAGRIDLKDVAPLLSNGRKAGDEDDDTPPPTSKPVRKRAAKAVKSAVKRGGR